MAGVALDNNAAPQDEMRHLVITPKMQAYIVDALKGLFQQATAISAQYAKGQMGTAAGFQWAMDQNCPTHQAGTFTTAGTVTGAGQTGSALLTGGWVAADLKKGDVFTIGVVGPTGTYGVNPQSRQSTGELQVFTLTADVAGAGALTLPIAPAIVTGGAFQTVAAAPAASAAITLLAPTGTSSPQGMAFHRDAFTLVTADLPVPKGTDMASRVSDKQLGISLRIVRDYDITTDQFPVGLTCSTGGRRSDRSWPAAFSRSTTTRSVTCLHRSGLSSDSDTRTRNKEHNDATVTHHLIGDGGDRPGSPPRLDCRPASQSQHRH